MDHQLHAHPQAVLITGSSWLEETRFANQLLRQGIHLLWVQRLLGESSEIMPGAFIIPLDPAYDATLAASQDAELIQHQATEAAITLIPVDAKAAFTGYPLRQIRVGLYGGGGAPFNHAGVFGEAGFSMRFLSDAQIRAGELDTVDILVMPGGGTRAMYGQLEPLGIDGARRLTQWVRDGGMYIGSCAGAYDCAIAPASFTTSCPPKGEMQLVNARIWNGGGGTMGGEIDGLDSPGVGVLHLRNTRPDHPVMFGMPERFEIVHYNGPVFDILETSEIEGASLALGLAAFDGRGERFTAAEDFLNGDASGNEPLVERASAAGKHSVVAGELGIGRVVAFGSHPEFGFNLAMDAWAAPARMLVNAALWQAASNGAVRQRPWSYRQSAGPVSVPRTGATRLVQDLAQQLIEDAASLRTRSLDPVPGWLTSDYAMSVFGLSPVAIWNQSVDDITSMAHRLNEISAELSTARSELGTSDAEREAAVQSDRWILEERAAAWQQDGGYQGVAALLRTAHEMCVDAIEKWDVVLGPPAGPYDYLEENPFHLVAGSYLAAVGYVSGAVQLLRALTTEVDIARRTASSFANREVLVAVL